MSPPIKWEDIFVLHVALLSVCLSRIPVRSISFEPLVEFTNNSAQMLSMMRRCAVPMFDQGHFKVKVKHCMTVFRFRKSCINHRELVSF